MSISRTGECPIYARYITEQALIPRARVPSEDFLALTRYNFTWIDIPSFQRGLVWDDELLENLLSSRSVFLGNAILGKFAIQRDLPAFAQVPNSVNDYNVLIDGLQRFSIGTALLSILFPLVLSSTPERGDDSGFFNPLKAQLGAKAPVFLHNDFELLNHHRRAVSESYEEFRGKLLQWVANRFEMGEAAMFADEVIQLFLQRQIAPDFYHGFPTVQQVVSTFIGLNTVRVQLNIVDWLRSVIIDQGGLAGWNPDETERVENRFSGVFNKDNGTGPKPDLIPLASIVKEVLTEGTHAQKALIFPSWNTALQTEEVDDFLEFVEELWEHDANPYVREIRLCGAIPFAALILYFYRLKIATEHRPSFLDGGNGEDSGLLAMLRGYYRVLFEGRVARTREFAKRLLIQGENLGDWADALSRNFIGKGLNERVDRDWLVASLKASDIKRARRIFNACLLPDESGETAFHPHRYGRNADEYQVDHMIPASVLRKHQPGGPEGNLLMNFAPIRKTTNIRQLNIQCSQKLANRGVYEIETEENPDTHPYLRWLVQTQRNYSNRLDDQALLQTASEPPLAAARITWLAEQLIGRL